MNDLLRPFLRWFVLVVFYDILIYSPTLQDHLTHLDIILKLLQTQLFFAKLSKCSFATSTVSYLGHIISPAGVTPDPEKIKAIIDWHNHSHSRLYAHSSASSDSTENLFVITPLLSLLSPIYYIVKDSHGHRRPKWHLQH